MRPHVVSWSDLYLARGDYLTGNYSKSNLKYRRVYLYFVAQPLQVRSGKFRTCCG